MRSLCVSFEPFAGAQSKLPACSSVVLVVQAYSYVGSSHDGLLLAGPYTQLAALSESTTSCVPLLSSVSSVGQVILPDAGEYALVSRVETVRASARSEVPTYWLMTSTSTSRVLLTRYPWMPAR